MTGEHLAIIILVVVWLLTAAWWRLDTARWHAKMDKLEDRLQSQVPQVLERQADREERRATLTERAEIYGPDGIRPRESEDEDAPRVGRVGRRPVVGESPAPDDAEGLASYTDLMLR